MKRKKLTPAINETILNKFYSRKDLAKKFKAHKLKINKNTLLLKKY